MTPRNLNGNVQESRPVEGGRRAGRASDGEEKEGAWGGASRHADQHGQSSTYVEMRKQESRCYLLDGKVRRATEADPWPSPSQHKDFA